MGGWLARLKTPDTHATKPTKPSQGDEKTGFVGFVADPAPASDPDRWCWPHSPAMNTGEIDTFMARLARFTDKRVSYDEAERLADALVIRDREGDDRRLCLECPHLQGFGRWRCGNCQAADVARQGLARDLVLMLQRCGGFKTTPTETRSE